MPIERYRSIEDMPPPWRDPDDPENLRIVAEMLALYRTFRKERPQPGVRKFRSIEEMSAATDDPFRR